MPLLFLTILLQVKHDGPPPMAIVAFLAPFVLFSAFCAWYYVNRNYIAVRDIKWTRLFSYFRAPDMDMIIWLEARFPFYKSLDIPYKDRLVQRMKIFLIDLQFEGDGVKVTDELKWILVATYAQITIGLDSPGLKRNKRFIFTNEESSSGKGIIKLNIEELKHGFYHGQDGLNEGIKLVFFALEYENRFREEEDYKEIWNDTWYRLWLSATKQEIQRFSALGFSTSRTGVTIDLNEFQHITIVYFFEMPEKLKQRHLNLYNATRKLMNWDPVEKRILR